MFGLRIKEARINEVSLYVNIYQNARGDDMRAALIHCLIHAGNMAGG